jgi:hypothetical protein
MTIKSAPSTQKSIVLKTNQALIDELWTYLSMPWTDSSFNRREHIQEIKSRIKKGSVQMFACMAQKFFGDAKAQACPDHLLTRIWYVYQNILS